MWEKSIIGSMPWEKRLRPSVTRSTLPVRSPLPNRQPSIRSAPASRPSSAAATPVPRSLCGCRLSTRLSRRGRCRCIHSIESAYTLGVAISTVAGRLMISLRSGVGSITSMTLAHTSTAYSSSVPVYDSGEYS